MGNAERTCIIDEHIQATKFLLDPVEGFGNRLVIFDVDLNGLDLAFAGWELRLCCLGSSIGFVDVATCEEDGVGDRGLKKRLDDLVSETGIGTGDEDDCVGV